MVPVLLHLRPLIELAAVLDRQRMKIEHGTERFERWRDVPRDVQPAADTLGWHFGRRRALTHQELVVHSQVHHANHFPKHRPRVRAASLRRPGPTRAQPGPWCLFSSIRAIASEY